MKATEFCYWLQGAFELTGLSAFTDGQLKCIRKHLELVLATDQTGQPPMAVSFCSWLRGVVDFISAEDGKHTLAVQSRLHGCFEHAIDHGYQNKEQLDSIHNQPNSGLKMRC